MKNMDATAEITIRVTEEDIFHAIRIGVNPIEMACKRLQRFDLSGVHVDAVALADYGNRPLLHVVDLDNPFMPGQHCLWDVALPDEAVALIRSYEAERTLSPCSFQLVVPEWYRWHQTPENEFDYEQVKK